MYESALKESDTEKWNGETTDERRRANELPKTTDASRALHQAAQRADEAVEHRGAAEARQFEGQRNRAADLRLELHAVKGRGQPFDLRYSRVFKRNTRLVTTHQGSSYPQRPDDDPQLGEREHGFGGRGKRPEAVTQLDAQCLDVTRVLDARQAFVNVDLHLLRGDIVVRQVVRRVDRHVRRDRLGRRVARHETAYRLLEHAQVHVEAHSMHEAGLLGAQQIAGPTHLEVLERDPVAGTELGVMLQDLQPSLGLGIDSRIRHHQVAIRAAMRTADPAAQLIELRVPELVRAIHEHRVRVRHVEARFDDHRRDEHVDLAVHERVHAGLQLAFAHLPVSHADPRAWHDSLHLIGHGENGLDAVVHEEHL